MSSNEFILIINFSIFSSVGDFDLFSSISFLLSNKKKFNKPDPEKPFSFIGYKTVKLFLINSVAVELF